MTNPTSGNDGEGVALLPCPFCGHSSAVETISVKGQGYKIMCGKCGAFSRRGRTKAGAITAWNTRATPTPIPHDLLAGTTPGPWKLNIHPSESQYFGNITGTYGKNECGIESIRTITCQLKYGNPEERLANARLLAAAPDLAAENARLATEIADKDALIGDLKEALEAIEDDCKTAIDQYERNGPSYTSQATGVEYEHASYVQNKLAELRDTAALTRAQVRS